MSQSHDELVAQLHSETAKLPWSELEKHFAHGSLIKVAKGLDLIEVGIVIANDDKARLEKLMADGSVANASTEDAKLWNECTNEFWTVVVSPWVLVQIIDNKLDS